jgi:GTP cyclohydrolase FolE2
MHHGAMLLRLGSDHGGLTLRFPWFVSKQAPASALKSWLDVKALYRVEGADQGRPAITQVLRVPVTTLCPCSKSISKYGAHNQRSYVTVALRTESPVAIAPLVARIEAQASCAIYALLKRVDEKFVTERAYENPKFAEDLVRDIYRDLMATYSPVQLGVATENQESIHNHAAFAFIGDDPRRWLSSSL